MCKTVSAGFQFLEKSLFLKNKRNNWPIKGELSLTSFALLQEPLNTLDPRTSTQGKLLNSKCPENVIVNGRYRVQKQVFEAVEACYDESSVLQQFDNAASAENNCGTDCAGWMYTTQEYVTMSSLQLCPGNFTAYRKVLQPFPVHLSEKIVP